MINLFDLHCDTVSTCMQQGKSLLKNDLHIDLLRGNHFENWIQVFALFLDTSYSGDEAYDYFLRQHQFLMDTIEQNPEKISLYRNGGFDKADCLALISVEGGHVLGGKLERIEELKKKGIAFLTLVWNGDNELGSGVKGSGGGLTSFGRNAVMELERNNIIADISHLNQKGTDQLMEFAAKPLIATHSNSRAICDNPRNLYDYQLTYLIAHDGICGINYYPEFLNRTDNANFQDIVRHIDRILALGGENILALGSDFDGAPMPSFLNGIEKLCSFYSLVVKWYGEKIATKLFYSNAINFIKKNCIF